jgi:hypothetical protein
MLGVEQMEKLSTIRNQEMMCREQALLDEDRRVFRLAQAENWAQRALDEITFHFRDVRDNRFNGEFNPTTAQPQSEEGMSGSRGGKQYRSMDRGG